MKRLNNIICLQFRVLCKLLFLSMCVVPLSAKAQTKVANEEQLKAALNNGGNILVTTDFSLSGTVDISKDVVLDLGNNILKCEKSIGMFQTGSSLDLFKSTGSNVVVKNGTIIAKYTNGWAGYVTAFQVNGGKVTFINCDISGYTEGITRSGTAIEYTGGNIQVVSGIFTGTGAGSNGKGYAFYSKLSTFDNFIKGCLARQNGFVIDPANKEISGSVVVSPINYAIKYDSNKGDITSTNYTTTYSILNDGEARTLPTVEREHYKFLHWFNNSGSDINENTPITPSTFPYVNIDGKDDQTLTFKAKWEALPYTIRFDTDGAGTMADSTYTVEDYPESLPTPVRDGYMFTGWFNGTTPVTLPFTFTGNISLTAHWSEYKYILSYVTNTETAPAKQNYTKATSKEVKIPAIWERRGYAFKGWYDNPECTGEPVTSVPCPQDGKNAVVELSLYAKWEAIPYTLGYTLNGGEFQNEPEKTYTIEKTPYKLPIPKNANVNSTFKGWYDNPELSGKPIEIIEQGGIGDKLFYAKWLVTYHAKCHWNSKEHPDLEDKDFSFTKEDEVVLPKWDIVDGYEVKGWYEKESPDNLITVIKKGTEKDMELYAKWVLAEYDIVYEPYHGTLPDNVIKKYTVNTEDIVLPYPTRSGFTFVGWFSEPALTNKVEKLVKGSMGNKTYYAKWIAGNLVVFDRPENGRIIVKDGSTEVKSGEKVGAKTRLTVTAIPDSSIYRLVKLVINGKEYTSSPQTVEVPADNGLTISAEFADSRPSISAPKILTTPYSTDFIPAGESVEVSLTNMDNTATLYYSIDGSTPKVYSQPFQVSSLSAGKTVCVTAYAKKEGCKDGVTVRNITFGKGKVTITFNLPKGIKAVNPEGGEVVEAIASGGSFEFKLEVDKNCFESLESLKVEVDGKELLPNARNIYTLSDLMANVVVKVSGITGITHMVTLKQSVDGLIYFTGEDKSSAPLIVNHGDRVSITAEPNEGGKFVSWTNGVTDNPYIVTVEKDTIIQARFTQSDPGYLIVLPTLTGAKVKPLSGYSTEVKKGGTFKFYISMESDYKNSVPEVFADGKKLTIYKDVYSLYNISKNMVIAVDGIRLNEMDIILPQNVSGINMETGKDIKEGGLTPVSMITIRATAPTGKKFSMWNDGKADNPRIIAARDAEQLLPLFVSATDEVAVKVELPELVGAGLGAVNINSEAIPLGENVKLKLVILPQYSNSNVKVVANGIVLEPDLSLKASSETKTLFYNLEKVTTDVKVEVSGVELNNYNFALKQTSGGTIRADKTGSLKHGTVITLTAEPANGDMFLKWSDGNTMNPYKYTLTEDCVLSAQYGRADIPLDNENVQIGGIRVYAINHTLHIETERSARLSVWNLNGLLVKSETLSGGHSTYQMSVGTYIVKVGEQDAVKVFIR
ncbi:InlB B-repeat-containing protein [uncultured Parabacteroides sp.]|uniref:InlB B-repeat-containing protein n=1 Tax=uncultured Parabacteroides sp. TaxID=512312 RepID=UPI0025D6CFB3|nr:InlB B-repeat-containing protein [uncultured Parabacteroides sp.]